MQQEQAEALALRALGWAAGQDGLLDAFLGASGMSAGDLRAAASDPDFLAAFLDFLLAEDARITGFCDDAHLPYDIPARARAALPGGQQVHWT